MGIRRRLASWLSWFPWYRRRAREADLKRELADHLELEAEEQRAAGLSPEEAGHAAHRALGNTLRIEEDVRAAWRFQWAETLLQDLRYGLRMLRKSPGFTTAAVLTLAIGLAANTAIFSAIDGVLLKPLAYPQPGRLVAVQIFLPQLARKYPMIPLDSATYEAWSRRAKSLEGIAAAEGQVVNLTGSGEPRRINADGVTPNMFAMLGVQPVLGRDFSTNPNQPTYGREVMFTYGFWQSAFHSDPEIVGRGITLDGRIEMVVGVLPASFHFPKGYELSQVVGFGADDVQIFLPILFGNGSNGAGNFNFAGVARLKPGVSVAQAQAELTAILHHIPAEASEGLGAHARAIVMPLRKMIVRQSALGLWVLLVLRS